MRILVSSACGVVVKTTWMLGLQSASLFTGAPMRVAVSRTRSTMNRTASGRTPVTPGQTPTSQRAILPVSRVGDVSLVTKALIVSRAFCELTVTESDGATCACARPPRPTATPRTTAPHPRMASTL